MAPLGLKLWKNVFQMIPNISIFDAENINIFFCKTLNGRLLPKNGSVRPQTLGKRVSDDPQRFIFRRRKRKNKRVFCKILNGHLPPEDGSVRPQTLGKHVSDDPRHFIFRRRKHQNKSF